MPQYLRTTGRVSRRGEGRQSCRSGRIIFFGGIFGCKLPVHPVMSAIFLQSTGVLSLLNRIAERGSDARLCHRFLLAGCMARVPSHRRLEEPEDRYALQFFAVDAQPLTFLVGCCPAVRYVVRDGVKWTMMWAYGHLFWYPSSAPGSSPMGGNCSTADDYVPRVQGILAFRSVQDCRSASKRPLRIQVRR